MDRPRSMIGSITGSAPSHKRNVSSIRSISKLQAPSTTQQPLSQRLPATRLDSRDRETIQLFITNLKLLHLDSSTDWPNITTLSLSSVDSKTRFRAAEWALYQLFRQYDQHMTTDKLQPFFPPLEPLQSVNLRAALYRCLNELKKNGVLGREVILRKTMLDECSGDKFWELCLALSTLVLRKVAVEDRDHYATPIAQRLATSQTLNKKERDSLLPLAVAHKSALSRVLDEKHRRRQSCIHVFDSMKSKEVELTKRKLAIDTAPMIVESVEHANELEMIEKEVTGNWTHNTSFKDAIVNGNPAKPGDNMLLQSTDDFIANLENNSQDTRRDSGVLEDIELQAKAQHARVREWQQLHARLQVDKRNSICLDDANNKKHSEHFDQHHDLGVENAQPQPLISTLQPQPIPSYVSKYDEILTNMREELRRAQNARREAEIAQRKTTELARQPSIILDAITTVPSLPPSRSASQRSISPTFPLRPDMARRVSSRSRSYQQPKVISQREPIPFKSEVFSPLKRTGSLSPASARSSMMIEASTDHLVRHSKHESQSSVNTPTVDSGVGLGVDLTDSPVDASPDDTMFKKPGLPASRSVSFAHRKSLSERTRLSMISRNEVEHKLNEEEPLDTVEAASLDTTHSLAARTRQSMSGLLPIRTTGPIHTRTSSAVHGIVPQKQRSTEIQSSNSLSEMPMVEQRRHITPREKLFDTDAEYTSVFRSRPKIASSPPFSPTVQQDDVDDQHLDP